MAERGRRRAHDAETSAQTSSWYRADTRRRWVQAKGYEPKSRQLDLMVVLRIFVDITAPNELDGILRSVGQLLAGPGRYMGWKSTGSTTLDHQRFSNRFKRGFDYLAVIGVVSERRYVVQPNGEGVGILVVPGPCSSTGRAADS